MRKRYFGDTRVAQEYTRDAAKLLEQVKQQMGYQGLSQLSRRIVLANGITLMASSVFGQDEIRVHAPARDVTEPVRNGSERPDAVFAVGGHQGSGGASDALLWRAVTANPTKLPPGGEVHALAKGGVSAAGIYAGRATVWDSLADGVDLGAGVGSRAFGMSWDGSLVVGDMEGGAWYVPLVWRKGAGLQAVGVPSASAAGFRCVTKDGAIAGGDYRVDALSSPSTPVTYTFETGQFQHLATPYSGRIFATSDGARVVCGDYSISDSPSDPEAACAWIDGVLTPLSNANGSRATGVSRDGRIVVGFDPGLAAWYWTDQTGRVTLAPGTPQAVSEDGRYAAGVTTPSGGVTSPIVWELATGSFWILSASPFGRAYAISAWREFVSEGDAEPRRARSA